MGSGAEERLEYLVVATVRRPHGLRGELLLALETDRPDAVFRSGRTLWLGDADGRPVGSTLTVQRARKMHGGMLLQAAELNGLTPEVEALRGRSLLIPADQAAPASADEIHYRELRGMAVFGPDGEIGAVREVVETAGGELLVVRRAGKRDALIPFVKEMVRAIDHESRRLDIDPPEGLLDL